MNRLEKQLDKLHPNDRRVVLITFKRILARDLIGLNVKKLKGRNDIFRVRQGKIRIIYSHTSGETEFISVSYRDEKTYKNLP